MEPLTLLASGLLLSLLGCSTNLGDCSNLAPSRPPTYQYPAITAAGRDHVRHLTRQAAIAQMKGRLQELIGPESCRRICMDVRIPVEDRYMFCQFAVVMRSVSLRDLPEVRGEPLRPGARLRGDWDRYDSRHRAWYYQVSADIINRNIEYLAPISDIRVTPTLDPVQVDPVGVAADGRAAGVLDTQCRRAGRALRLRAMRRPCGFASVSSSRQVALRRQLRDIWRQQGSPQLLPEAEPPRRQGATSSSDPVAPQEAPPPEQDPRSLDDLVALIQDPAPPPPRNSRRSNKKRS